MPRTRWPRPTPPTNRLAAGGSHQEKPLLGIPIAIKDVLAVKDQPLNCGSKILGNFASFMTRPLSSKLKAAGAIVFGRLNMDEFAMGSSTENSAFGITRNPWDTDAHSRAVPPAVRRRRSRRTNASPRLGTDTGGSIRQPAALCGVRGAEADLRTRFALWPRRLCVVARPDRAVHERRARCGDSARSDQRP